jgi:radical SAM superfamily enzyme YgiQ (UPF0313 family)
VPRTPAQIQTFLDDNAHRQDMSVQYLGTEPNAERRPWDTATVRWCLMASWPYEAAAGNQSIPAVYKAIHDADPTFLCDRFYLPATPSDLRLLEKNHIPVFGIESKHQLTDFDVIATSISYPVLSMSFIKMLTMSGISARWTERDPNTTPMVMVGGLSYGAPEVLSPVVDCWWLGEVEDEPGNPGIGAVTTRIAAFKQQGRWGTDRLSCYADLAREFNYLYFPRFVDVHYQYEDRSHVGVGPRMSKQVTGYTSNLPGMRLPFRKRHVRDLDAIPPLDNPPLLYADPAMGSGDLEVARGCPAWCSFPLAASEEFITREGVQRIGDVAGKTFEVWTRRGWRSGTVEDHGHHQVQKIVFRPADRGTSNGNWRAVPRAANRVTVTATPCHGWVTVDGGVTHALQVGQFVWADAVLDEDIDTTAFVHGFLFGDGHQRHNTTGKRQPVGSGSFKVRLHGKKARVLRHFQDLPERAGRNGWAYDEDLVVTSISNPDWADRETVVYGWASFNVKSWPRPDSSPAYLRGFLAGWMTADACARTTGGQSFVLDAQYHQGHHGDVTPTQWLQRHAASAGVVLVGYSTVSAPTNYGPRSSPLVRHSLVNAVIRRGWVVESITPCTEPEQVYCLTVPGERMFTLASGITTGNCALTFRAKPYRQRSVEYVVDYAKKLQDNLGSTRMAPFSPDLPMHTQRRRLISELLANVSDEVDAASMRVDDFTADNTFILLQVHGGMDAVTLGVEGNSQRMRDLVGKGTSDAEIKEAVTRGIRSGIRKFKLFMISNLPGEDEGDVYRILKLAKDLADIRDSMGQSTVRIQFSWTPLMIEANTPFQWFAPQPANRILGDVWEDFRDLKIDFKIGAKAEPNKMAFFQLCQRASRDVGEALVDAMIEIDQACWGGVPRTFKDLIEAKLVDHGFQNGYADCFDERYKHDMFGWEFIDQGISNELLWATYVQMREFVEQTDSHTYDLNFGADYRGSEWLVRCNEKCYGKSCGACSYTDLKIRNEYIRAEAQDVDVDLASITTVDQHSQAVRIRAKITKPETLRFVGNDHWRFAFRRACFRAQTRLGLTHGIAKRSIRFASDETKYRDWTAGTDYVEFAFTRPVTDLEIAAFLRNADIALEGRMHIGGWARHPVDAVTIRADVDLTLFDVEIDVDLHTATQRLTAWANTEHVDMRLKIEGGYFAPNSEQVNAKDYVEDLWLLPDGHRLHLRMLIRGRPNPYNITAAVLGKQSWLPFAKHPARRVDVFIATDRHQQDFLRPVCTACGLGIPINLLDQPYHPQFCPRCYDEKSRP